MGRSTQKQHPFEYLNEQMKELGNHTNNKSAREEAREVYRRKAMDGNLLKRARKAVVDAAGNRVVVFTLASIVVCLAAVVAVSSMGSWTCTGCLFEKTLEALKTDDAFFVGDNKKTVEQEVHDLKNLFEQDWKSVYSNEKKEMETLKPNAVSPMRLDDFVSAGKRLYTLQEKHAQLSSRIDVCKKGIMDSMRFVVDALPSQKTLFDEFNAESNTIAELQLKLKDIHAERMNIGSVDTESRCAAFVQKSGEKLQLEAKCNGCSADGDAMAARIDDLVQAMAERRLELAELQQLQVPLLESRDRLQKQRKEKKQGALSLENRMSELEKEIDSLTVDIKDVDRSLHTLQQRDSDLANRIASDEGRLKDLVQNESLESRLAILQEVNAQSKSEFQKSHEWNLQAYLNNKKQIENIETQRKELKDALDRARDEHAGELHRLNDAKNEIKNMDVELAAVARELSRDTKKQLEGKMERMEEELVLLRSKRTAMDEKYSACRLSLMELVDAMPEARHACDEALEEQEQMQRMRKDIESRYDSLSQDIASRLEQNKARLGTIRSAGLLLHAEKVSFWQSELQTTTESLDHINTKIEATQQVILKLVSSKS